MVLLHYQLFFIIICHLTFCVDELVVQIYTIQRTNRLYAKNICGDDNVLLNAKKGIWLFVASVYLY